LVTVCYLWRGRWSAVLAGVAGVVIRVLAGFSGVGAGGLLSATALVVWAIGC